MGIAHMIDASKPPASMPPGYKCVAGYIGGNTPHVWTLEEWLVFADYHQLPIWTLFGEMHPYVQADRAAQAAKALGWRAFHSPYKFIAVDYETSTDAATLDAFDARLHTRGFRALDYGSFDDIVKTSNGLLWPAQWGPSAVLPVAEPDRIVSYQYANDVDYGGTKVDLSMVDTEHLVRFGHGPRHHV